MDILQFDQKAKVTYTPPVNFKQYFYTVSLEENLLMLFVCG